MKSTGVKIIVGVVMLLLIGAIAVNLYLDHWLGQELKEILNKNPDRSNNILFKDLKSSIWTGDISLTHVEIISLNSDTNHLPIATVEHFGIEGVSFYRLINNKEVVTRTLMIRNPQVALLVSAKQEVVGDSEKVNALWADILTRISVKNFEIEGGVLVIQDEASGVEKLKMSNLNLTVTDIVMDTSTFDDPFPFTYRAIDFSAEDVRADLKRYNLGIGEVKATEYALKISKLKLDPKPAGSPQSISILSEAVDVTHFDWGFIQEKFYLRIEKLEVTQAELKVLQKRKAKYSSKERPLLPSTLRNLPIKLHVDSITVKDTNIIYDQINEETGQKGELRFTNFYSTAYNITNDAKELERNGISTIDIQTGFMDHGQLKAQFHFDLLDVNDEFRASGSMAPMDLNEYNKVLKPLASVEVEGQMDKFDYAISGNKWKSSGSVNFDYDNLHVNVLNQEKERKNRFLSSLGHLVIDGTNQPHKSGHKIGAISRVKEQNKSFFAYLWNSLKSGIIDVVAPRMGTKNKPKKKRK